MLFRELREQQRERCRGAGRRVDFGVLWRDQQSDSGRAEQSRAEAKEEKEKGGVMFCRERAKGGGVDDRKFRT